MDGQDALPVYLLFLSISYPVTQSFRLPIVTPYISVDCLKRHNRVPRALGQTSK